MSAKIKKQEFDLFNKLSEEWWDENGKFKVLHQIRPIRIEFILDQLAQNNMKNPNILDLGCGGGLISESMSRLGCKVTGIDFVKKNIEVAKLHAKKKKLNINYIHADIEKYITNKKYDVIIMFEILEHLNNWRTFIKKINNNLKKNGIIIISTINRNILSKYLAIYFAENILKWIPKGTHTYEKFIKPQEIKENMKVINLNLMNLKGMVFDPINLNWKLSNNTKVNYFCSYKKN